MATGIYQFLPSIQEIDAFLTKKGMPSGRRVRNSVQNSLDQTSFAPFVGEVDNLITQVMESSGYFNMDIGVSYVNFNYFAHLTLKNVLFSPSNIYGDEVYDFSKNYTSFIKYVASFGYTHVLRVDRSFST